MTWTTPLETEDWEADFEGTRRFQLRYFKSFTFREKLQALEDMAEVVELFRRNHPERGAKVGAGGQ